MDKIVFVILLTLLIVGALHLVTSEQKEIVKYPEIRSMDVKESKVSNEINDEHTYVLELEKWNIYNDGTHPVETTKGLNDALIWAKDNGYTVFKIPDGNYLIAKQSDKNKENDRIKMVSNMTLLLSENTIIQKETNDKEEYQTVEFGPDIENSKIIGGTLIGDKDTHDYSKVQYSWTSGSHEWGMGINIVGAENVLIENVKIREFTGDGIYIGGSTVGGKEIGEKSFENGGINNLGELIPQEGKIRLNDKAVTDLSESIYKQYKSLYFWVPSELISNKTFDIYYYGEDDTFISAQRGLHFNIGKAIIPEGADYYRAVFSAESIKGAYLQSMVIDNSKNIIVRNNEISFNRRQGITAGGENVLIEKNNIHDIGGTPPGAGIDIEPGFFPAIGIDIKENKFTNNTIHAVLAYGKDSVIDKNYFGPNASLEIWKDYIGKVEISNNTFDGSVMWNEAASKSINNTVRNGTLKFEGEDMLVDGITGEDSTIVFNAQKPLGISGKNIILKGSKEVSLSIWNNPIHLEKVKLDSPHSKFEGDLADGSVFNDLSIKGYTSVSIPNGVYNNCLIDESSEGWGLEFIKKGTFEFNNCTIMTNKEGFKVNHIDADLRVNNSNLSVKQKSRFGLAYIYAKNGKNLDFSNNSIDMRKNEDSNFPIVKFDTADGSEGILQAQFIANTFYSNFSIDAIDTLDAGFNAPQYLVKDNVLNKTKLNLRAIDINKNNKNDEE